MTKTIFVDWRIVWFFAPPFPQGGSKECVLLMKTILRSSMPILCKWYEGSFVVKTLGNVYMGRSCSLSAPLNAGGLYFMPFQDFVDDHFLLRFRHRKTI